MELGLKMALQVREVLAAREAMQGAQGRVYHLGVVEVVEELVQQESLVQARATVGTVQRPQYRGRLLLALAVEVVALREPLPEQEVLVVVVQGLLVAMAGQLRLILAVAAVERTELAPGEMAAQAAAALLSSDI